jgi:hypothetical protein
VGGCGLHHPEIVENLGVVNLAVVLEQRGRQMRGTQKKKQIIISAGTLALRWLPKQACRCLRG